ncbi:MAG: leucyl/phenylalanyl-tRNA--protein transferase [Maribacter sp.]|nr:MAG: leucyl/phenylalanyl-tRNA--protein transferase [Maribacter sp.]
MTVLANGIYFPPVEDANADGLLAVGGDLSPERLILAYKSGIFPWFNEGSLVMWWSPDPRMVLYPAQVRISKSMRKILRGNRFQLTKNTSFEQVIDQCAKIKRKGQDGTWITHDMKGAYLELHAMGFAQSYEVWEEGNLVGGLYGIDLGHVFCGESMFSKVGNASKYAFLKMAGELGEKGYRLIDCQLHTSHLESLGAKEISRPEFLEILRNDQT